MQIEGHCVHRLPLLARACANLQPVELSRSSLHACQLPEYVFRASELRCNQKFPLKSDLSTTWRCVKFNVQLLSRNAYRASASLEMCYHKSLLRNFSHHKFFIQDNL